MITGVYSVRGVLLILSRIKVYRMDRGEIISEIPKKALELITDLKIDLNLLRKNEELRINFTGHTCEKSYSNIDIK